MTILPPKYVSIEEEYKRNPELKPSDLQMLKDWMEKQPHLPKIDVLFLVFFLHSNYYRMEPTKKAIDNFYTVKTHLPEVFCNRDPIGWKSLREIFSLIAVVLLRQKTKEGYVMIFIKILDPNTSKFDYTEYLKYLLMMCEVQTVMHGTSEGLVFIFDATNLSFGHIANINLMIIKKTFFYIQQAPVRLKAFHILNATPMTNTVLNLIKPFMTKKLIDLIHFHPNMESIEKYLPIEALPNEYGGKTGPIKEIATENIKLLEEFRDWFQYDEIHLRVNESLRVGKSKNVKNLFGVDGSFKKLEIN